MPERLFLFVQFEFPWPLDLPDGRYLLRSAVDGEPEHVMVLRTLGARAAGSPRGRGRALGRLRGGAPSRQPAVASEPDPAPLASARATIIDPVAVSAEPQARAWLTSLDPGHDVAAAVAVLNRILQAQRIATADPYVREVSAAQAARVRAGWGEGEQVAEGRWLHAIELPASELHGAASRRPARGRRRSAALRPQERLARLLGARERPLLCEELALRARLDLDQGRTAHAAFELERAYRAALIELAADDRADLPRRVDELGSLHEHVARAAEAALPRAPNDASPGADDPDAIQPEAAHAGDRGAGALDEELIEHALGRLEAALRARSAAGFDGV